MADDAECYGEVWDAVQKAIVEVDEAENAEPEFEPTLTAILEVNGIIKFESASRIFREHCR